jgi:hypothetical protein
MASTPHQWEELRRTAAMARYLGVEANEISPTERPAWMFRSTPQSTIG